MKTTKEINVLTLVPSLPKDLISVSLGSRLGWVASFRPQKWVGALRLHGMFHTTYVFNTTGSFIGDHCDNFHIDNYWIT